MVETDRETLVTGRPGAGGRPLDTAAPPGLTGTPVPAVGALVPQAHGGALRQGNPGNIGGGALKSEVREELRVMLLQVAIPYGTRVVNEAADGKRPHADAMEILHWITKAGLGEADALIKAQAKAQTKASTSTASIHVVNHRAEEQVVNIGDPPAPRELPPDAAVGHIGGGR